MAGVETSSTDDAGSEREARQAASAARFLHGGYPVAASACAGIATVLLALQLAACGGSSSNDAANVDLGLWARPDGSLQSRTDLCGAFKVPNLRNVALRRTFFHNGRFTTPKDALTSYVQRDTNPGKFYPVVGGVVQKFDDLPATVPRNVDRTEAPHDRNPGDAPALSDGESDDVIAFPGALTDGFAPSTAFSSSL